MLGFNDSQVTSSPPLLAGAAALAVGLPAAGWVRDRLGGYSGQLPPARALELLQSDNAILLDMRCAFPLRPSQNAASWKVHVQCPCVSKYGCIWRSLSCVTYTRVFDVGGSI